MVAIEKRRKRRESHNAVERRRRDNINDRISELSMIVPECAEESASPQKPNKGAILRKSADYIRYLQTANQRLLHQLELNGLPAPAGTDITGPLSSGSTAAAAAAAASAAAGHPARLARKPSQDDEMQEDDDDDDDGDGDGASIISNQM